MKILKKEHECQCMLYAFAMAMNLRPAQITSILGHDGTDLVFRNQTGYRRCRGFHEDEFQYVARCFNIRMYRFGRNPGILNGDEVCPVHLMTAEFYKSLLYQHNGVIIAGEHALAFSIGTIYDPDTGMATNLRLSELDWRLMFIIVP